MTDNPREFFPVSGFCFCLFEARCYSVAQAGLQLAFLRLRRASGSLGSPWEASLHSPVLLCLQGWRSDRGSMPLLPSSLSYSRS